MSRRILMALVTVAALSIVVFFVPAAFAIHSAQERGELLELQQEASAVAISVPPGMAVDLTALGSALESGHDVGLYDARGRLVTGVGPATADKVVDAALGGTSAEGRVGRNLVAAVPVRPNATTVVVARIEAPLSESRGRFVTSLTKLAGVALALVCAAAVVGLWLSRRLNRPIDELGKWASDTAAADPPRPTGIAELDSLRQSLLEGRERIDDLLDRERSFSSHVSHQLRTPVAAMRIAIEAELSAPRDDPQTVLVESLDQIDRLESTIVSLLAVAREHDRPTTNVDLGEFVSTLASRWRPAASERNRSITLDAEKNIVVRTDTASVEHVVDVLVDNSLRHGAGAIAIRVHRVDAAVAIVVADDGATPDGPTAFGSRAIDGGHGIGLRLARMLAESVGGRLELLTSETTTFRLLIPAAGPFT